MFSTILECGIHHKYDNNLFFQRYVLVYLLDLRLFLFPMLNMYLLLWNSPYILPLFHLSELIHLRFLRYDHSKQTQSSFCRADDA